MKRTFSPARGLDDRGNLQLLRGDLDRLLAEYAGGDFSLAAGAIRFDREGQNATIKLEIALRENGITVTREVTAYNRNAERLGINAPLGATVSISGVGLGVFVGYNRRASKYPFLFQVSDSQGNGTSSGITYKLTVAQAKRARVAGEVT